MTTLVICPCTVFRFGIGEGQFVAVLVAAEVIMLWVKVMFFGLAIDGLGTFIFMVRSRCGCVALRWVCGVGLPKRPACYQCMIYSVMQMANCRFVHPCMRA